MKNKEYNPLESAALLVQRVRRKGLLPPKYHFLDYVQAIRQLKKATIAEIVQGDLDELVANCLAYAQYHDDRTAFMKLAYVLFSGDRKFNPLSLDFTSKYHNILALLLQNPNTQASDIVRVFNDTFSSWKKYHNKARSFEQNYSYSWIFLHDRLINCCRSFKRESKKRIKFNANVVYDVLGYESDYDQFFTLSEEISEEEPSSYSSYLFKIVRRVIDELNPIEGFEQKQEFDALIKQCNDAMDFIDKFINENYKPEEEKTGDEVNKVELEEYLKTLWQLRCFIFKHAAAFNNGFHHHSSEKHWNYQGHFPNAKSDTTITIYHGGGLFYMTDFLGGEHPGYRADREAGRRGIYVAIDAAIAGRPIYSDSYYAHREAPYNFDIPTQLTANIKVQDLDDSVRVKYEAILTKESVPKLSNVRVSFFNTPDKCNLAIVLPSYIKEYYPDDKDAVFRSRLENATRFK